MISTLVMVVETGCMNNDARAILNCQKEIHNVCILGMRGEWKNSFI